jgi:hypothetical protein
MRKETLDLTYLLLIFWFPLMLPIDDTYYKVKTEPALKENKVLNEVQCKWGIELDVNY